MLRLPLRGARDLRRHVRKIFSNTKDGPDLLIQDVREHLKHVVGSPASFSEQRDADVVNMQLPRSQDELPARSMRDSYRWARIPLGSDAQLREKYVNFHNQVRFGRLLEDLDTMSVWISYTHNQDPAKGEDQKSPVSIVTANVDRIDFREKTIHPDQDIDIKGYVSWVGSSSLEVSMDIFQNAKEIIAAKFLMVAREPLKAKKAYVNPIEAHSAEESAIVQGGEVRKQIRLQQSEESLFKRPPNEHERQLIHQQFLQTIDTRSGSFRRSVLPPNTVWMEKTLLKNIGICFPQRRNLYNKIFGGYLMRKAFELAWANACVFSKMRPLCIGVDDILFRKPVHIGSLLYLSSQVVYTKGPHLQIKVHAEVVHPKSGHHDTTNIFHFTFTTYENVDVQSVMPKTYAEYMMFTDGKRHYEASMDVYGALLDK